MSLNQKLVVPATHYDLSMGSTPYQPEGSIYGGSTAPTENSSGGYNPSIQTNTCVRTSRSIGSIKIGEAIALPFHVPNLNPNNKTTHDRLRVTCEGPISSKRRMFMILWINHFDLQTYDPNRPMTDSTTVHLTGGIRVDPQEHISTIGRFTEASHGGLLDLCNRSASEAQEKPLGSNAARYVEIDESVAVDWIIAAGQPF